MTIPFFPYKLFFLYIEPLSALGGAIYAGFLPKTYLRDLALINASQLTREAEHPTPTLMALFQLANLYLLFALNEHLVLSSTQDIKTWQRLLLVLLIADFGHLLSLAPLGPAVYWRIWEWNAMMWGSVGFVYLGATTRICFLMGVGFGGQNQSRVRNDFKIK